MKLVLPSMPSQRTCRRFLRFGLVGGSGVLVDMGVLFLLSDPRMLDWDLTLSKTLAAQTAILNNFVWNDLWTFGDLTVEKTGWRARARRLGRFNLVCLAGIGLNVLLLTVQVHGLQMNVYVANCVAVFLVSIWNFAMNLKFGWNEAGSQRSMQSTSSSSVLEPRRDALHEHPVVHGPNARPISGLEASPEDRRLGQTLILLTLITGALYYGVLFFLFAPGIWILYLILVSAESFRIWQTVMFCCTVWPGTAPVQRFDAAFEPSVDLYITVAGEAVDLVRETIKGAQALDYPGLAVYVLNDGLVTGKPNWKEIEALCGEMGVQCITRTTPGGAKAGNINHALSKTTGECIAIFDADHVPKAPFLRMTLGYFADAKVGFVQTPQYYRNHALCITTAGAWQQQELFFDRICKGKGILNSVFMCGTNLVFRRKAVAEVGGLCEKSITEDFLTSMFLHEKGWRSVYVPEVLAEGLAPEDLSAYAKQQFRWARGTLDVVFRYNPFLRDGLTLSQKMQYLASASYWLLGLVVALNASLPLIYLFTGLTPLESANAAVTIAFLPFITVTVLLLREMSNSQFRFQGICFSLGSFPIYLKALLHLLCGFRPRFEVTPKRRRGGGCWLLILPLGAYVAFALVGWAVCFGREGLSSPLVANCSWTIFYMAAFSPILAAAWQDRTCRRQPWMPSTSPSACLGQARDLSRSMLEP